MNNTLSEQMFLQTVLLIGSKKIRALFKGFYKKIHCNFFIILRHYQFWRGKKCNENKICEKIVAKPNLIPQIENPAPFSYSQIRENFYTYYAKKIPPYYMHSMIYKKTHFRFDISQMYAS